jgi:TRAP-type C4-dicarboxylate transport system substrate-binding protein
MGIVFSSHLFLLSKWNGQYINNERALLSKSPFRPLRYAPVVSQGVAFKVEPGIFVTFEPKPKNNKGGGQMKRCYVIPLMIALVITLSPGAPTPASASGQKTWTIKLHYEMPNTAPLPVYGFHPWAKAVEKATKGRVKVQIYPGDTLFKTRTDAVEGIKAGLADVAFMYAFAYTPQFDLIDVITAPFFAPNAEVASRTAWALYQKFPEIQAQWKDVKLLSTWSTDPYILITTKKQIKTLEDFKGMKMRVTGGLANEMMKRLGGVPVSIPMPQNYINLQKGVIDGMAGPGEAISGFRLYEVVKYYTMAPTTCTAQQLIMNKRTWNGFTPEVQEQIMSVSGENAAIRMGGGCFDRAWTFLADQVKKSGHQMIKYNLPKEEMDRWVKIAGKPVWDMWVKKMEKLGHKNARQIQEEAIRLVEYYSQGKTDTWRDLFK